MSDISGTLILLALGVLFGFLGLRSWKLKNPVLKWGSVAFTGLLTLICTAALGLAMIGFAKLNQRYPNPVPDIKVAGTAAQITPGQRLAYNCLSCHAPGNQLPLQGVNFGQKFDFPLMGRLYAPNLFQQGSRARWPTRAHPHPAQRVFRAPHALA